MEKIDLCLTDIELTQKEMKTRQGIDVYVNFKKIIFKIFYLKIFIN